MKTTLLTLIFACTTLMLTAQSKTETLKIATSAKCGMCKKTMETSLPRYEGISTVSLDVPSKVLTVTYNPKATTPEKIRKAVNKTGYDADGQPADQKAHDRLKPCCRKDAPEHKD